MVPTTPCPGQDALQHYSVGNVRESEAAGVEAHLAGCPHCVQTLHGINGEDTLVDAMRAQCDLMERPKVDEVVTQLMVVLKGWNPTVSLQGVKPVLDREAAQADELSAILAPPERPGEIGRLGAYRILGVLGVGGMGVVFEAEDPKLRRPVALKALRPLLAASDTARKRFLREARAAAAVTHDNVVTIYEVGDDRGIPFFAMPYLAGETLEARLRRDGPLPLADIVRIGRELADGLSAAHARGLLHRDVKPANVWLEAAGSGQQAAGSENGLLPAIRVKLLDFGLAWAADDNSLTDHGTVVGTPAYMAPEQARGESADVRSDLFSLGSVLYAMCTGAAPFQSASNFATLEKVRTETPRPIAEVNPGIPQWLADLIMKLHAKNPADRCQSAAEVAARLADGGRQAAGSRQQAASSRPARWWVAAAAVLLLPIVGLTFSEATGMTQLRKMVVGAPEQVDAPKEPVKVVGIPPSPSNEEPKVNPEVPIVPPAPVEKGPTVYPAALFAFEVRDEKLRDLGPKVTDLLFARLAGRPELYLVDRSDMKKILAELELNISGVVKPNEATKIGQLTGAKILISGSVMQIDKKTYLVAKIIGTETTRMVGVAVDGNSADDLAPLVNKLADQVADTITKKADQLVAKVESQADRIARLNKILKGERPVVYVKITERHLGAAKIDPAAQTEMSKFCKETGFTLIDPDEGLRSKADVLIVGEAFSETATRTGNLFSVKARVEIRMMDRKTDQVIAVDRQTALVVDLTENIASKAALQEATAILAERMLPKLVK